MAGKQVACDLCPSQVRPSSPVRYLWAASSLSLSPFTGAEHAFPFRGTHVPLEVGNSPGTGG